MNHLEKMLELYPDTKLVPFKEGRALIGNSRLCCAACPANYPNETAVECGALDCGPQEIFVSPVLYIVASVNKWSDE